MDHRGPEFSRMVTEVLEGCRRIFQTSDPVVIFPSSGTGAWEAALVNILSPGDKVLMFETGHFATMWRNKAVHLGIKGRWWNNKTIDGSVYGFSGAS